MDNLAKLLACSWLFGFAILSCLRLSKGIVRSVYFLYIVHFVFCGFPLLLDILLGSPEYRNQPGYYLASSDTTTTSVYCVYVSFVPLLWCYTATGSPQIIAKAWSNPTSAFCSFGYFKGSIYVTILMLPFILVAISPEPKYYMTYGMIVSNSLPENVRDYHGLVGISTLMGLVGITGIFLVTKKLDASLLVLAFFLTIGYIWLNGKRYMCAVMLMFYMYVLITRGCVRGYRLLAACVVSVLLLIVYNDAYQKLVRQETTRLNDFNDRYEGYRVDYGRDAVIRFTIYAELHPDDIRILEYRGQSVLFNFVCFIPRSLFPNKPWPYASYLTCAVLFRKSPDYLGWGLTTSWLEESIANFGWAGVLIGPLCLSIICRAGDHTRSRSTQALGISVGSLLLAVELSAFMVVALIWCAILGMEMVWDGQS